MTLMAVRSKLRGGTGVPPGGTAQIIVFIVT